MAVWFWEVLTVPLRPGVVELPEVSLLVAGKEALLSHGLVISGHPLMPCTMIDEKAAVPLRLAVTATFVCVDAAWAHHNSKSILGSEPLLAVPEIEVRLTKVRPLAVTELTVTCPWTLVAAMPTRAVIIRLVPAVLTVAATELVPLPVPDTGVSKPIVMGPPVLVP